MTDKHPFRVNRSALPLNVSTLFNPENCFARGGLKIEKGKPVLTGNCQVVQFGKNSNGNNCMFVCQADFSKYDEQQRPVLASIVFDHQGRAIDLHYGNSSATPSEKTKVLDGTRASFGFMAPPPPPSQQPTQSHPMLSFRIQEINEQLKKNAKNMTEGDIELLLRKKASIKEEYEAEAAEAAKAAKAAREEYDKLIKIPRWGCTSVLKGPLEFLGCQRDVRHMHHSCSLVEGFPYVSCVRVDAEFDKTFEAEAENLVRIQPYFEYDPITKESKFGSKSSEFYDGEGFGNRFGNPGHTSFLVRASNSSVKVDERRKGHSPHPKPIPEHLSASFPETNKKFKRMLAKGNASLRSEMKALEWLATTPLNFPTAAIDSAFADHAFHWVHELSTQFEKPSRLTLSSSAMAKMLASKTHASPAAMHAPAMRGSLFEAMTRQPIQARQMINSCPCTPTHHDPRCLNQFCPVRHARLEELSFEWPPLEVASVDPSARLALESEILRAAAAASAAATAKQQAAEAAEEKRRAADAAREAKNARAREATAQRQLAAASAEPTERARRSSAAALASVASSALAPAAAPAVASSASRKRKTSDAPASAISAGPASAAPPAPASAAPPAPASASSSTKRKARGGAKSKSKSKSKSKRRVRK
jgi:hypothetical protein